MDIGLPSTRSCLRQNGTPTAKYTATLFFPKLPPPRPGARRAEPEPIGEGVQVRRVEAQRGAGARHPGARRALRRADHGGGEPARAPRRCRVAEEREGHLLEEERAVSEARRGE